jgi:hypothetical protein
MTAPGPAEIVGRARCGGLPPPPGLVTTREAAAVLGITAKSLRVAARAGHVPAMRLGPRGLWRFDPRALVDLLDRARGQVPDGDRLGPPSAQGATGSVSSQRLGTADAAAVEAGPSRVPVGARR